MAPADDTIEIAGAPALERLVETVHRSGRPLALTRGTETVAIVQPVAAAQSGRGARRRQRGSVLTSEDTLWKIVGAIDDEGPSDVSSHKHRYLAEAYAPKRR